METSLHHAEVQTHPTARLLSLDVARGITIAFMIMVNNNGAAAYGPFKHSSWNGWTPTDLVFPYFLFLVGTSIVLSQGKRLALGTPKSLIAASIVRRTAILFVLGLVVNGFPFFHLDHLRLYGVLQRIALCFCCVAFLFLWKQRPFLFVWLTILLLVGYWVLMRFVPVPGAGVPGRDIALLDPNQNWTAWLDRKLLTGRLYEGVRDPEGLLSTLPAIASTALGLLAGMWLQAKRERRQIALALLCGGIVLFVAGELWNLSFPINKKLWTSSFVLLTAGSSTILLALLYWLIDVLNVRGRWEKPWLVFGTNAIFAYMLSELLATILWVARVDGITLWGWIYVRTFEHIPPPGIGSLVYSITFTFVCWLATYVLWKRRIFLRV